MVINKILGNIVLLNKDEEHIEKIARVITTIYNIGTEEENDMLLDMYITITKRGRHKMSILLPVGWSHIRHKGTNTEVIIDSEGITRITIDRKAKKSTICKRYGYIVRHLATQQYILNPLQAVEMIEMVKYDRNKIMEVHILSGRSLQTLSKEFNNEIDAILEHVEGILESELSEKFPDWKNPLAYWELENVKL